MDIFEVKGSNISYTLMRFSCAQTWKWNCQTKTKTGNIQSKAAHWFDEIHSNRLTVLYDGHGRNLWAVVRPSCRLISPGQHTFEFSETISLHMPSIWLLQCCFMHAERLNQFTLYAQLIRYYGWARLVRIWWTPNANYLISFL